MHNDRAARREQGAADQVADDKMLALQARRDPQAFAELYRRYIDRIYRFLLARTGSIDDAQDLASQTFLAALEQIGSYSGRGTFIGWLFAIASHKRADHYRRQRPELPLDYAEDAPHPGPSPEDAALSHLQLDQVIAALHVLAPDQAEALTLRVFGELDARQVGEIMNKSEAAVKMLVHRGLRRLQERLAWAEVPQ